MQISFTYPDVPAVEIPDSNLLAVLQPARVEPSQSVEQLVQEALDHPVGTQTLERQLSSGSRILILVDDITRQTPAARLLPEILRRVELAGCPRHNLRILVAAGTHARMSREEVTKKLGEQTPARYEVHLHHWREEDKLQEIGTAPDGTPIRVNRMLSEADFIIGVGMIVPHRVMGFTGGSTIVQPGVSGPQITGYTHWQSALFAGHEILGIADNPVRREVEQIARLAGLRFIVNVVMDAEERVLHVIAGDPVAAHRQGAEHSRRIYGVPQPRLADIVIAESFPADYDLWQAAKGIYSSELAVAEGGVVILVTPCPHGVSDEHPEVEALGYHGLEAVKKMVEEKAVTDLVAAAHLVHVGRVIRDRARGVMVSPGIAPPVQRHLGFEHASTPQKALERAFELAGRSAGVVVLRHGGDVLPLLATTAVAASAS